MDGIILVLYWYYIGHYIGYIVVISLAFPRYYAIYLSFDHLSSIKL